MNQAQMQIRLEQAKNRVREIIAADLLGATVDANGKPKQAIVSISSRMMMRRRKLRRSPSTFVLAFERLAGMPAGGAEY